MCLIFIIKQLNHLQVLQLAAGRSMESEKPILGYYRDRLYLKSLSEEDQRRIEKETKEGYIPGDYWYMHTSTKTLQSIRVYITICLHGYV